MIILGWLRCSMCLGMSCATVCVLSVCICSFVFDCLSLDLGVWGSMLPLFGTTIATIYSLLKLLPCLFANSYFTPFNQHANNCQKIHSCSLSPPIYFRIMHIHIAGCTWHYLLWDWVIITHSAVFSCIHPAWTLYVYVYPYKMKSNILLEVF